MLWGWSEPWKGGVGCRTLSNIDSLYSGGLIALDTVVFIDMFSHWRTRLLRRTQSSSATSYNDLPTSSFYPRCASSCREPCRTRTDLHVSGRWDLIYIGAYTHKFIGHETANWRGWDGRQFTQESSYPTSIESDSTSHDPSPDVHTPSKWKTHNRPDSVPRQYVFSGPSRSMV
jgi:hypothetical protein